MKLTKLSAAAVAVISIALLARADTNSVKWLGRVEVITGTKTNLLRYTPACSTCNWGSAETMLVNITTNFQIGVTSNGTLVVKQ